MLKELKELKEGIFVHRDLSPALADVIAEEILEAADSKSVGLERLIFNPITYVVAH